MNLNDKIKGALFGMALGDALGLGTEFMSVEEIKYYYPDGMRHFSQIIRDAHRSMWKRGDWTNDTQTVILLIESIMECGKLDLSDYASKMKNWFKDHPTDMVDFYHFLFEIPEWEIHPREITHKVWRGKDVYRASNEALPRAIITGILGDPRLMGNSLDIIAITHDDTRCSTCGAMIAVMADSLLRKGRPANYKELEDIANTLDPRTLYYLDMAHNGTLSDICLDNEDSLWFARKTMAAAIWSIWHCSSPEEVLHTMIDAGGDADTNAALAMGLAGLQYGYDALPDEVNKLLRYDEMEKLATRFIDYVENIENSKQ